MNENENIAGYTPEEWKQIQFDFEKDWESSQKYHLSFRKMIREILAGETPQSFSEKTGLSPSMLSRMRNQISKDDQPRRNTLISICIAYNVDIWKTCALIESLGLSVNEIARRDYIYSYLLTRCRGKSVDECNEILKQLGVEERYLLGKYARRKW